MSSSERSDEPSESLELTELTNDIENLLLDSSELTGLSQETLRIVVSIYLKLIKEDHKFRDDIWSIHERFLLPSEPSITREYWDLLCEATLTAHRRIEPIINELQDVCPPLYRTCTKQFLEPKQKFLESRRSNP